MEARLQSTTELYELTPPVPLLYPSCTPTVPYLYPSCTPTSLLAFSRENNRNEEVEEEEEGKQ